MTEKKAVHGSTPLHDFDWVKIDGEEINLDDSPIFSIYERCQAAKRSTLKRKSAFADYTAEFRKKQNCFVIVRRGNGYA